MTGLSARCRFICDHDTYIARYDDLMNGRDEREPNASVQQMLSCYHVLHELDRALS